MQDIYLNHLRLKFNATYEEDEKKTKFEPVNEEDILNETSLDRDLFKVEDHIPFKKIILNLNCSTTNNFKRRL